MKQLEQTFFTKVNTRRERERAFNLIANSKAIIEAQINKKIYMFKSDHLKDATLVIYSDSNSIDTPQNAVVSFNIGSEKYFMKTVISKHDFKNYYTLNIGEPLFKLQRRGNFRIQIPIDYHSKIKILKINDSTLLKTYTLSDLSSGGFSIEVKPSIDFDLKKGDLINGEIEIGGKFKKNIYGVVKHVAKIGSQGSGLSKCGFEFQNISNVDQQQIINLVMDLYRDIFSKFKIGSR